MGKKKYSEEELVWVKEKYKFFGRLESYIKQDISKDGYKKLVKRDPLFIGVLLFSIISSSFGFFGFYLTNSFIFFAPLIFLLITYFIYYTKLNSLMNKNAFILVSELKDQKLLSGISAVMEESIFSNKNIIEDVIVWRIQQNPKYKEPSELLLKYSSWTDHENLKNSCKTLASITSSLQRIVKSNGSSIDKAIKKGVTPSLGKVNQNVNGQTFNSLPRPSIKPLFQNSPPANNSSNGVSLEGKKDSKTHGLFQAPNKPLFGQDPDNK